MESYSYIIQIVSHCGLVVSASLWACGICLTVGMWYLPHCGLVVSASLWACGICHTVGLWYLPHCGLVVSASLWTCGICLTVGLWYLPHCGLVTCGISLTVGLWYLPHCGLVISAQCACLSACVMNQEFDSYFFSDIFYPSSLLQRPRLFGSIPGSLHGWYIWHESLRKQNKNCIEKKFYSPNHNNLSFRTKLFHSTLKKLSLKLLIK